MVAVGPDGETEYVLHDDGQHCDDAPGDGIYSYAYECWDDSSTPYDLGEYTFTVTDQEGNTSTGTDEVTRYLDLPENPSPSGFIDTLTPTFSWDPVPYAVDYNLGVNDTTNPEADSMWGRGGIDTNSVVYNDDGNGQALAPYTVYEWGVGANDADGNMSWHHTAIKFVYSDGGPVITDGPWMDSHHNGDDNSEDQWLDLGVCVDDPDGLGNVASVVVTAPDGSTQIVLIDDGQHCDSEPGDGCYGQCGWTESAPQIGEYLFSVTDADGHEISGTDVVERIMDFPTGLNPPNNGFATDPAPTFSWDPVSDALNYNVNVQNSDGADIWWRHNIEGTGVVFNDDGGASETLVDGQTYLWNVTAFDNEGNSGGHHHVSFIYSTSGDAPIFIDGPVASSMHWGVEGGDHQYGLNLWVKVADPQGLSNVASVVAVGPDGETEYVMHDDGMHCDDAPRRRDLLVRL